MADRVIVQATKTELPIKIILGRQRKRYQNTDLLRFDCQSFVGGSQKEA
jgi:hypothetical protein